MRRTQLQHLVCSTLFCVLAAPACAQRRPSASQHGTVSQEIATTKISIEYDRPVARGRQLFGALVPWGKAWTPGANWATTIELSDDVQMEGQQLPKGRYSIWTIPQEQDWTVIFSKNDHAFHMRYPEGQDALRVQVHPLGGAHMETLALYFPVVGPDSAVLNIHWGTTVVPLHIRVK
jgi:hypothetical protein